jgi:hypothetical protein
MHDPYEFKFQFDWTDVYSPGHVDNYPEFMALSKWCQEAKDRNPNSIAIEIGSFHGRTAVIIANFFKPLICIDLWAIDDLDKNSESKTQTTMGLSDSWRGFMTNMNSKGLINHVLPICASSEILDYLPPLNIEFAFVDGDHDERPCYKDCMRVERHLSPTGYIAAHDYKRGEDCESWVKPDKIQRGWGNPPFNRSPVDPWGGVAKGVDSFASAYNFEIYEKVYGIVCLKRK